MATARWWWHWGLWGLVALVPAWGLPTAGHAAERCEPSIGTIVSAQGEVSVLHPGETAWLDAALADVLCVGDRVRVGERSRAAVLVLDTGVLRIDANTTLELVEVETERSFLDLVRGAVQFFSREPASLRVGTPYLNAGVEGTEFLVRVGTDRTRITVYDGVVVAANARGEVRLGAGETAVARAGQAPTETVVVQPLEGVTWALYYPPILTGLVDHSGEAAAGLPERLADAARLGAQGKTAAAFDALKTIPADERDSQFYLYRAALLLAVGQVDQARADIGESLRLDGSNGLAYALGSVIAVAQNDERRALADGQRAVDLDPAAAAPKIALSYALQANMKLEDARDLLVQAVEHSPDDPLAWARLGELQLALGNRDQALTSATRAATLSPTLARAQTVLGFAALSRFAIGAAETAFRRAIDLDPASPLPRLGLGLAQIRVSDLQEGRRNLETAVALDPGSALLRTYLGRAYFEEKRERLAGDEFAIAKDLDPRDPTAYLYDAILKQTENRPVEALEDAQRAIELNDDRLVYRGRLLLDEDVAARGAAIARIYDDLGFERLGSVEADEALSVDPGAAAAHRFLADVYRTQPRREISRVSELLQSQLFQDVSLEPVQPRFVDTNLGAIVRAGPTSVSTSEFTPLFERNGAQLLATGVVGNHDTYGGEAVVSGRYENAAISAGYFHFQTNGFRENFDSRENVVDVFAQVTPIPELSLQVEYFRREADLGDIELRFDPDDFVPGLERDFNRDLGRIGGRVELSPSSDVLFSVIYADYKDKKQEPSPSGAIVIPDIIFPGFPPFIPPRVLVEGFTQTFGAISSELNQKGYQGEGQYVFRHDILNAVAGFTAARLDNSLERSAPVFRDGELFRSGQSFQEADIDQDAYYLYSNLRYPENLIFSLGVSYNSYQEGDFSRQLLNPKVGVEWTPIDRVRLRAGYVQSLRPSVIAINRTIEPTQVVGFNQFFDDPGGTLSRRYGVGLDVRLFDNLFVGADASRRTFEVPVNVNGVFVIEDREERLYRGYVYWAPWPQIAFRVAPTHDTFENETDISTLVPDKLETTVVPVSAGFFHPSGFFAEAGVSYVNQDVTNFRDISSGSSDFTVVDLAVGYRLPNRLGLVSLQVNNLFDSDFRFLDDSFREFSDEPSISAFIPDRTILGQLILNF